MDRLKEFEQTPDEGLNEPNPFDTDSIASDMFNSAGNTNLSNDEEDDDGGKDYEEIKANERLPNENDDKELVDKNIKKGGATPLGKFISGKTTVTILNIFLPAFIVFAVRKMGYGNVDRKKMKLTTEEKEILTPIVQECLDYVVINFNNPFYMLAFSATMIYGAKVMDVIPEIKKIKEEEEEEKEETEDSGEKANDDRFIEYRKRIDATTIKKEKRDIIIEAISDGNPENMADVFDIYKGIFPSRSESYFKSWYEKNYEAFPDSIKFKVGE